MSEILTTCDKIQELPNNTLAILRDSNNIPCFILKDYDTKNLDNINIIHCSIPNSSEVFLLKLSNNKIYKSNFDVNETNKTIFSTLFSLPSISVFLFANEPDVHSISKVVLKNVDFKNEIFNLSDNNKIWNLLTT